MLANIVLSYTSLTEKAGGLPWKSWSSCPDCPTTTWY